jgi:glycosyltransferase involved in cell wall biosynthesis
MKITVIVPVKNEAPSIAWILDRIPTYVAEVIVVDGNSTDDSVALASSHPRVSNVIVQRSNGKGAALSAGFAIATGELVAIIDADGSMKPAELSRYLEKFPEYDVVKGSRYLQGGGSTDLTLIRSLGNKVLTGLANILFQQKWTDMAYGYAVFKKSVLDDLALTNYDKLGSILGHKSYGQGFEIETLMFTRAARRKMKIVEVPSFEENRIAGSSNLRAVRDGFRVLIAIFVERSRSIPEERPVTKK